MSSAVALKYTIANCQYFSAINVNVRALVRALDFLPNVCAHVFTSCFAIRRENSAINSWDTACTPYASCSRPGLVSP